MGNKLYVGNLPYRTNQDELKDLFSQYGEVTFVRIITDRDTGRSRGFGFVEMATPESAEEAISSLHDQENLGRKLIVNIAKERK